MLSSFSSALHYGQSIFEGLKAYSLKDGAVGIFRLDDHARRFKQSAKIMGMPEFSEEFFKESVIKYIQSVKALVPKEEGHSFYIRPLMFSNDPVIKVHSGYDFRFFIMGSIVGDYFNSGVKGAKVFCNKNFVRAFPNGTGQAKTAANYALSLLGLQQAQALGYEQVLYLNAKGNRNIDELGGMNFFMLKNKKIITPTLHGTILAGITRATILEVAKSQNFEVEERDITIDEVVECSQEISIFASGTAATIVPIEKIGLQEDIGGNIQEYFFHIDPKVEELRNNLISCHKNESSFSQKWLTLV
ncbi:MAG: branched-chain-amino-acid transaminase [Bdellovibrionales bacterium]|nr:branched-chain-amino-acid transaminase [Bdellovibrionales bacterium]